MHSPRASCSEGFTQNQQAPGSRPPDDGEASVFTIPAVDMGEPASSPAWLLSKPAASLKEWAGLRLLAHQR